MVDYFEDRWWIPFAIIGAAPSLVIVALFQLSGVEMPTVVSAPLAIVFGMAISAGVSFWFLQPLF